MVTGYIPAGSVEELDPQLNRLVMAEDHRQKSKIILIPSESIAPPAVRALMSSNFGNIYAEGYPRKSSQTQTEDELMDLDAELAYFRRFSDPRYYKGVEYADVLEALCRRRAAKLFSANDVDAGDLLINVQPLSGSPANTAVYSALLEPGDTVMGLDLIHGGHLTHGSPVNRSGKLYNFVPYTLDLETERLNYDAIEELALKSMPKLIVAGFTAYPLLVDWSRFRQIADKCGAYLMADIAHISGLVATGVHPSPIGIADIVTTTTHKSLCGPRGAMIMTHRPDIAVKVDRSVFPGEQGGPHLNTIAALALALKLASTDEFVKLQELVVHNASRLAAKISEAGIRVVSGGSENHLLMLDMKSITNNGVSLSGDMAARILDVAGIVTNRNTIPGDRSPFTATGVRMGTVWISQLGFGDAEIDLLGEAIATVLNSCKPFAYPSRGGKRKLRSKVDDKALQFARNAVVQLTGQMASSEGNAIEVRGKLTTKFLDTALGSNVLELAINETQRIRILGSDFVHDGILHREDKDRFMIQIEEIQETGRVVEWLKDLSDGYIKFNDLYAKLPGSVVVSQIHSESNLKAEGIKKESPAIELTKPFFVGHEKLQIPEIVALPEFDWLESEDSDLKRTNLFDIHVELGGRMIPFAGWEMPVWYSSVSEEHAAVRETAGLFDVSHMGVIEVSGPGSDDFLNHVTTNDIQTLQIGRSHYSYLLFPNGDVVDDLLVYRRASEKFMLVVNASNNDKVWSWLNAVNLGKVQIDHERPWAKIQRQVTLRDLRDPQWRDECRVDIALQGPRALDILQELCDDEALAGRLKVLPWSGLTEGNIAATQVIISRTGYTGERIAFELFVHPNNAAKLWLAILERGKKFGLKPCGLAARDSTRTEAGLPLYGHELAGPLNLNPANAGFASYVKLWKPFFIGRKPYINSLPVEDKLIVRFRMEEKGVRRPELGDPVMDKRGKIIGTITSCAIDNEGFLLGQAALPASMTKPGTALLIYQLGGGQRTLKVPREVKLGSRLPSPSAATVISRFPPRKK
jgi:glycine hydroxymethyltransferase